MRICVTSVNVTLGTATIGREKAHNVIKRKTHTWKKKKEKKDTVVFEGTLNSEDYGAFRCKTHG